jgi:O-antigen ligase
MPPFFIVAMNHKLYPLGLFVLSMCWLVSEHFPPWYAFHTEVPAFAAVFIGLVASISQRLSSFRIPSGVAGVAALLAVVGVQWASGLMVYGGDAWVAVAYVAVFGLAWLWAYNWVYAGSKQIVLVAICYCLICIALVTSLQVFAQWLQVDQWFDGWVLERLPQGRPRANLGQPNQAATTLVMAMVAAGALFAHQRISYGVACLLVVVFELAAVLTQSRTALLSATVIAIGFLAFARGRKLGLRVNASVIIWLATFMSIAWVFASQDFMIGAPSLNSEQITQIGTRPLIWRQLCLAVLEKPWFGWGALQLAGAQQLGGANFPGTEQANYAHNILLDSLVMLGIPITIAILGAMLWWFFRRWKHLHNSAEGMWSVALLMPIIVHAMLEYPHAYAYYLVLAGLLIGLIDASTFGTEDQVFSVSRGVVVCISVTWLALLLLLGREYMLAEEDFRMNRFENRRIGPPQTDYQPPRLIFLTQLSDQARAMRLRAVRSMPPEDVDTLDRVAKRYTWGAIQFRAALALALNGRPDEAGNRLRVIKSLFAEDIYAEARDNFLRLAEEQYPELKLVTVP